MRPFPASTISGSASRVDRPEPPLRAVVGHDDGVDAVVGGEHGVLPAKMPLMTIFILVVSRSRFMKSQVMADDWVCAGP